MQEADRAAFAEMISGVYEFYGKAASVSEFALQVWWQAMQQFDLVAVREALGRHAMNPDSGQFLPRPADVVRMMQGSTQDSALTALTKLETAISSVGSWGTVAFDDALIHVVVEEMGGWISICAHAAKEWEFRLKKEFCDRYRAYKARGEVPPYGPVLMGLFDAQNVAQGFPAQPVKMVGDVRKARQVAMMGSDTPRLTISTVSDLVHGGRATKRLADERRNMSHETA